MSIFSSLTAKQREAVGILQIGTLLEYFDLYLFVHMAVVLNEVFFPKCDPVTAQLLSAMAFCSTFVFRPFGALLFGYIGDTIGRKPTIILTTALMAVSCIIMANVPTYAQIGITASWVITICRIVQGMSSMGEMMGAEIYMVELIKPPAQYPLVCFIVCASCLGIMLALAVATAVFAIGLDWRIAFWVGAIVALVGVVARTALRETPDFIDAQRKINNTIKEFGIGLDAIKSNHIINEKVNTKTALAYFLISCSRPVWVYFVFFYCAGILKDSFNYTPEQIIRHNFIISILVLVGIIFISRLSFKIYPLKIVKVILVICSILVICIPYLLSNIHSPLQLLIVQSLVCFFQADGSPADAIFITHFPIFKRFTYLTFLYALSRAIVYIITSFGLIYLTKIFGHNGLLFIMIPTILGVIFGIKHFEKLEKIAFEQYTSNNLTCNLA